MKLLTLLLALLCTLPLTAMAEQSNQKLVIYQPNYKTAAQLMETVKPLYQQQATFSVDQNRLIVRAEAQLIERIEELLKQLDQAERMFTIEFSREPPTAQQHRISTAARDLKNSRFRLYENKPLQLYWQRQGQQLNNLVWLSLENRSTSQQLLKVKLAAAKQQVYIDITLELQKNQQVSVIEQQLTGKLGEWLTVAIDNQQPVREKTYSTGRQQLYLRVIEIKS